MTTIKPEVMNTAYKPYKTKNLTQREVFNLVAIGFCQPKFYKRSVWLKAKRLMDNVVCKSGLGTTHDFGFGKGKFTSEHDINYVQSKVVELLKQQGSLISYEGEFVLVRSATDCPVEKDSDDDVFDSIRTISITTTTDNEIVVPVFDKKHLFDGDFLHNVCQKIFYSLN